MVGSVAMRAPRRVASIRACVWLREVDVGAKTTSARAIASATSAGGSSPCRDKAGNVSTVTARARGVAAATSDSAITRCSSLQTTSTESAGPTPRQTSADRP